MMSSDLNDSPLNRFSLSQAKHVFSNEAGNLVLSPLSTLIMLTFLAAGSNGPTRDQIVVFLLGSVCKASTQHNLPELLDPATIEQLNSVSPLDPTDALSTFNLTSYNIATKAFADGKPLGGPRLSLTHAVWLDHTLQFKPAFTEILDHYYKPATYHVDFMNKGDDARKEVNSWASKEVFPPGSISNRSRFIFANASRFEGAWEREFDASETEESAFFLSNRATPVQVPFMTSRKNQYIGSFDGFKVLRLPYKRGRDTRKFSMCMFLPDTKDGLPALFERIGSETGPFIERHVPYRKVRVGDFLIPRFRIKSGYEAREALQGRGLVLPFRPGALTEMFDYDYPGDGKDVVGRMFQKSIVEVNEHGTNKGGGDGAAVGCGRSIWGKSTDFVADHPFLFVIRDDKSGLVLFIGQLVDVDPFTD